MIMCEPLPSTDSRSPGWYCCHCNTANRPSAPRCHACSRPPHTQRILAIHRARKLKEKGS